MGGGTFDAKAYSSFTASTKGKATADIFTSTAMHKDLNPYGVKIRESRDSADSPHSTPLIVGVDVTGSMDMIASVIARQGLGTLFTSILERKPISDPHVMFMGIGDANCDRAPLQVSQFEADNRVVEQLTQIYIEHGGGGNNFESYNLPWYFAAYHTEHDSYIKRAKRGYLFTIGDEEAPHPLTKEQLSRYIGDNVERELPTKELLTMVQRTYDVYHVIIEEGSHARSFLPRVQKSWRELLGQKVISLTDHTKLAETISSAIEVAEGTLAEDAAGHWGGATTGVVYDAVKHLPRSHTPKLLGHP